MVAEVDVYVGHQKVKDKPDSCYLKIAIYTAIYVHKLRIYNGLRLEFTISSRLTHPNRRRGEQVIIQTVSF